MKKTHNCNKFLLLTAPDTDPASVIATVDSAQMCGSCAVYKVSSRNATEVERPKKYFCTYELVVMCHNDPVT